MNNFSSSVNLDKRFGFIIVYLFCSPFGASRVACGRPSPLSLRRGPRGYICRESCISLTPVALPRVYLSLAPIRKHKHFGQAASFAFQTSASNLAYQLLMGACSTHFTILERQLAFVTVIL